MDLFHEMPCLVESSDVLEGADLCRKWFAKANTMTAGELLRKFVEYNSSQFEFLDITPLLIETDKGCGISFRTSRFVGAIPLRAPDTGKQIGDFVVASRSRDQDRFGDYIEIVDLLGQALTPVSVDSLPLASGRNFRPPFYLEAVRFVVALENMLRKPWRKFECVEAIRSEPRGQINWRSYVAQEPKAENRIKFPVRQNVLSEFHREFRQIRFVFDICSKELHSPHVPLRIRNSFRSRLEFIEQRLYMHRPLFTESFAIKAADRPAVKACKEQANRILKREHSTSTAWRIDFGDVFEKFVLHIFDRLAHSIGGKLVVSPQNAVEAARYHGTETRKTEPDAVLDTRELQAFVNAAYKPYLLDGLERGDLFEKEGFKRDRDQIIAQASGSPAGRAIGLVCCPSDKFEVRKTRFDESSGAATDLLIVGIPLRRSAITEAVAGIAAEIDRIRERL